MARSARVVVQAALCLSLLGRHARAENVKLREYLDRPSLAALLEFPGIPLALWQNPFYLAVYPDEVICSDPLTTTGEMKFLRAEISATERERLLNVMKRLEKNTKLRGMYDIAA